MRANDQKRSRRTLAASEEETMIKLFAFACKYFGKREEGATMVEYGMMLFFIALVCFSAVQSIGVTVKGIFPSVSASL
jgi:pilus assembly protein Flp/PilA